MSIYALSDIHGNYNLWEQIKKFLKPTNRLVFLGDAMDRGPAGYQILTELRERPWTIYLKGNHEEIAAAALPYIKTCTYGRPLGMWLMNGGKESVEAIKQLNEDKLNDLSNFLSNLPINFVYTNENRQRIICNHCGFTPKEEYIPLWDRRHFSQAWPSDPVLQRTIIVHGHTPTIFLKHNFIVRDYSTIEDINTNIPKCDVADFMPKAQVIRYCGGHKIDIDMGTFDSGRAVLLNLETFEEIYFDER